MREGNLRIAHVSVQAVDEDESSPLLHPSWGRDFSSLWTTLQELECDEALLELAGRVAIASHNLLEF